MAKRPNPTFRRRQLGKQLRRLRENIGMEREEVADYLDCKLPKISKIETGKLALSSAELRLLAILFELSRDDADQLLEVGREARKQGWWTSFGDAVPSWLKDYVGLESDAGQIDNYEAELVHGLLQTESYARNVIQAWRTDSAPAEVERAVRLRMARQEHLLSEDPPTYRAVLNEGALRRVVGGPDVMQGQLRYLLALSEHDHINLHVIPFAADAHPAMGSSFTVLRMPDGDPIVYLEDLTTGLYLEKDADTNRYVNVFDQLWAHAVSEDESRALINRVVEDMQ